MLALRVNLDALVVVAVGFLHPGPQHKIISGRTRVRRIVDLLTSQITTHSIILIASHLILNYSPLNFSAIHFSDCLEVFLVAELEIQASCFYLVVHYWVYGVALRFLEHHISIFTVEILTCVIWPLLHFL